MVTAYAWEDGEYTRVARKMVCSTGLDATPTPAGTYKATGPVARWCYFPSYGCWAQYAFRIKGGVLFHSVLYRRRRMSTLIKGSVKKLGHNPPTAASGSASRTPSGSLSTAPPGRR